MLNKLYKGFMYAVAFIETMIVAFVLGSVVSSYLITIALVVINFINEGLYQYITANYTLIWLIVSSVPAVIFLVLIWRSTYIISRKA